MKCALMIPNFGLAGDARLLADLAAEVEEEGWDGFFIWDHLQWPNAEPCVDPWVALAAVAMKTTQISIGTMVTPLPRRDVAKLARETVSIDRLSQGRLIFGAGLGWQGIPEWDNFGHEASLKIRAEMLDEGLDLLIALWSGNPVDHDGKYYKVTTDGFASPAQQPRIPIWVGGTWPSSKPFRRAARWDGVMPISKQAIEGNRLTADDLDAILIKIREYGGQINQNFAVAITGNTEDASDLEQPRMYANAGANWWIEGARRWMTSLDRLRDRIRRGPPKMS